MNLFGLLCLLVSTVLVNGSLIKSNDNQAIKTEQYLLTYPQILSSTGNKLCLTLLNGYVPKEKDLHVTIKDSRSQEILNQTFRLEKESQCFDLEIKNSKSAAVTMKVKLDTVIDVPQVLPFMPTYGMTMIETSKPVYQPGESLKLRVIGFDGSMKPLNNDLVSIAILNPENVKVMEWQGKALEKGMKHYEAELASNTQEGIWKIVGETKSGETVEKLFQVAKKIQPEVNLKVTKADKFILANEETHQMTVCAEDKKGVRLREGFINVKVANRLVIRETPLEEDGCVHFHLKNETFRFPAMVGKIIEGAIEFKNLATSHHEYKKFYLSVVRAQVHLRVPSSALVKNYFKSGLPYFGYLIVETPNYTPLANAEVEICFRTTSKPWQFDDSREKTCKTFTSSADGLIKFVIPPVDDEIKQIFIEATIPGVADHQQSFVLNSWAGETPTQFIIKPILRVNSCKQRIPEATQFTILMTRNGSALFDKLYLQLAGRVSSSQTKLVNVKPTPYQPDSADVIGNWPASAEVYSANIYREANPESDKHSIMNRIVMYGLDHKANLISDSVAYLKDCLRDESLMSVDIDEQNRIAVDLKVSKETPCSVAIGTSAERGRLTEQKINKLAEKYDDIYAKTFEWDRCSLAQLERNSEKPLIVDFKNNWDTFKEMGLRAIYSESDIFNKPCQWEVFDSETVNKSIEGYLAVRHNLPYPEHVMTSLADSANMAQLNRMENTLINDLLFWGSKEDLPKFLDSLKASDLADKSEIAVHAICMDRVHGVRSLSVLKPLQVVPLYIQHDLPRTVYQETTRNFTLYIKRHLSSMKKSECIPIELKFEISDAFSMASEVKPVCSCSKVTEVPLTIKPRRIGPLNLKVVARFSSSLNDQCSSEIEGFEPQQAVIKTNVEVYEPKITIRNYELACKNLPKTIQASGNDERIHITQDLINIFIKRIRDDKIIRANIFEVLGRFNGLATMYAQNEKKLPTALARRVQRDILKLFQELALYKLPRGPFSINSSNQRVPSLVATSLAYKAIAQIQDRLPQFNGADALTEALEFIAGRMMKDGCFRPKIYSNMPFNSWPFGHVVSSKELTAFVASTLAEVKQTPKIVLKRALKCIDQLSSESSDYLTRAMTALLYAKMNKTDLAIEFIRNLESDFASIQNLGERRIPSRFMSEETQNLKSNDENLRALAYLVKAKLALNQTDSIRQHIQKLVGSDLSLDDPLVADGIASAWRIISNGVKPVIAEIGSKKVALENFEIKKIESPEKKNWNFGSSNEGCVILERVQLIPFDKYNQTFPFIRKAKSLETQRESGESCRSRRINICVNKDSQIVRNQPTYMVQLPEYHVIDTERVERMKQSGQTPILSYEIDRKNLNTFQLIVAPIKDECFAVPVLREGIYQHETQYANVTMYSSFESKPSSLNEVLVESECLTRTRRSTADQSNSSASSAKPNRSTNSQQPNNNQGRGYDTQVEAVEQQQTYDSYPAPAYEAPVKGYPAPAYPAPAYEAPAYQAPAYEPPVKGYPAPAYAPPAYEPTYQAPAYEAPVKGYPAPAYAPPAYEPTYQAPAYEAPVKGYPAPAYAPPAYEPTYQAPAYEAPVKGYPAPAYQAPAYEPTYQAPAYEPAYQAPAYEPPVKGYPAPAYAPPAYEPTYQAPAYEAPVKGYPAPAYQAPAYEPPAYPAPAYAPPAYAPPAYEPTYQAPAYEAPVKGYPAPAYAPPAYEPAYQAPAYEPPVKGYPAPAYQAPAYEPTYQAPAYEAPVKGYPAPAYAPPAYAPPAYAPPAYEPTYQAPAYEAPVKGYPAPAYQAPAYEPPAYPAPAYAPPAYAPPAYAPPAYAPPAYEPAYPAPAYPAPAYEAPAKGYPALPPPPAYAPPTYDAPAYRKTQGRSTQHRYGNSFASNNGQQARNSANPQRGSLQNQQRDKPNQAFQQARAAQGVYLPSQGFGPNPTRMMHRQAALGGAMLKYRAAASEVQPVMTKQDNTEEECQNVSNSCPVCLNRFELGRLDDICNSTAAIVTLKPSKMNDGTATCGVLDVNHSYGTNLTHVRDAPFSVNPECICDVLSDNYVIMVSDLLKSNESSGVQTRKAIGKETIIMSASPTSVHNLASFYNILCRN